MDKNSMIDSKKLQEKCDVHRMPRGMQAVHRNYGLWILSSGNTQTISDSYHYTPPRYFEYFSISHMYGGKGRLWLPPDSKYDISEGNCVIIPPQSVNRYGGINGHSYKEDAICFTGPIADMLFKSGILSAGVFELGRARLLLPIHHLASDPAMDSQINANIALQKLLIDIYNINKKMKTHNNTSASIITLLLKTIKEQIERWWTVEEMAEFCGFSKDQFRRIFKKHTGILPKLYLDRLKLQKAAEGLISSNMKIADIAKQFDYKDCYHFSRRFKSVIGFSPRRYRQVFGTTIPQNK